MTQEEKEKAFEELLIAIKVLLLNNEHDAAVSLIYAYVNKRITP